MDKFVKDAFDEIANAEYNAYKDTIVAHSDELLRLAGKRVGEEKVERLSKIVVLSGNSDTLAEFISEVMMACFTAGWTRAKEQYLGEDLK